MKAFSGIRDIDKIILNQLDPNDLVNVCHIKNVYIHGLCNEICKQRVSKEFPNSIDKPNNINWSKFYILLVNSDREYQSILSVAKQFESLSPEEKLLFINGREISRKTIRKILKLWIDKYINIMNESIIMKVKEEIENAMTNKYNFIYNVNYDLNKYNVNYDLNKYNFKYDLNKYKYNYLNKNY